MGITQQLHDTKKDLEKGVQQIPREIESRDNCRPIRIKRRINLFYIYESKSLIFALYEDADGNIHYRYMNYDTNKYKMYNSDFNKQFQLR